MTGGMLVLGVFLLAGCLLIRHARGRAGDVDDDLADARDFIALQIDAHIETLARTCAEGGADPARRPHPDRVAREIERFIGEVLLPKVERAEPWLKSSLREIVVLERDWIYGEATERVQAHLRRARE